MIDGYKNELESIKMSAAKKDALVATLEQELLAKERRSKIKVAEPKMRKRMPLKFAAAVAACVALGAGTAYATGALVSVSEAFDAVFRGVPAKTEVVNAIGRPIGASATDNGVTISADAIIGDGQSYSIVYSVTFADGLPEGLSAEGTSALIMEGYSHVADSEGAAGSGHFYDADPSDSTVNYVEQLFMASGESVVGKTCVAKFNQIVSVYSGTAPTPEADKAPVVIAEGNWDLRFTIDYEDTSVDFLSDEMADAGIVECRVSPVSVTVAFETAASDLPADLEGCFGQLSLVMKDGSELTMDLNTFARFETVDEGNAHLTLNRVFESVIDVEDIQSVKVDGIEGAALK